MAGEPTTLPAFVRLRFEALLLWVERRTRRAATGAILASCRSVGTRVDLRMPVTVYHPEDLTIGNDVAIGEYTVLRASGGLTIGNRVLLAAHVVVTTRGHPIVPPRTRVVEDTPVVIEDDVWLGAGAIVLPGVTVGRGSVVAAGAVVVEDVPPGTVVAGVPARVVRTIEADEQ